MTLFTLKAENAKECLRHSSLYRSVCIDKRTALCIQLIYYYYSPTIQIREQHSTFNLSSIIIHQLISGLPPSLTHPLFRIKRAKMGQKLLTHPTLSHQVSGNGTEDKNHSLTNPLHSYRASTNRTEVPRSCWASRNGTEVPHSTTPPFTLGEQKQDRSHSLTHPPFQIVHWNGTEDRSRSPTPSHWASGNGAEATHSTTHPFTSGKWKRGIRNRSSSLAHPPFHTGWAEMGQRPLTHPFKSGKQKRDRSCSLTHPPFHIMWAETGQKPLTHPPTLSHNASRNGTEAAHHSPQPRTPRPLIMVVWESVPTTLSGYSSPPSLKVTRARYSRFTWCTMPDPGGTISMFCRDWAPHWNMGYRKTLLTPSVISMFCRDWAPHWNTGYRKTLLTPSVISMFCNDHPPPEQRLQKNIVNTSC